MDKLDEIISKLDRVTVILEKKNKTISELRNALKGMVDNFYVITDSRNEQQQEDALNKALKILSDE